MTTAPSKTALESALVQGLIHLQRDLSANAIERLLRYLGELARWNQAYNLTAVSDPLEMVNRHLIDSLSVRPFLRGHLIADVGTGAGLPGMVLAIAEPERKFMLIDSNGKKIRFLRHVVRTLGLTNIKIIQSRIENLPPQPCPDEVVSRALAPLPRMVEWLKPWLEQGSRLLAMKGPKAIDEIRRVGHRYHAHSHRIHLGSVNVERWLVEVTGSE